MGGSPVARNGEHTGKIELATSTAEKAAKSIRFVRIILGAFLFAVGIGATVTLKYVRLASASRLEQLERNHAQLDQRVTDHVASTDKQVDWLTRAVWELVQRSGAPRVEPPPKKK